jgi:hypothetical protein
MAHGFSAVKEMYLDSSAEVFAAAGLNALVFGNRCFGASAGEPRQEIDPWAQVRDYRNAITYASTLPEVDAGRIGITRAPAWRNEVTLRWSSCRAVISTRTSRGSTPPAGRRVTGSPGTWPRLSRVPDAARRTCSCELWCSG